MDNQNVTITTEELKELIENAVYKAINGQAVNYEIITENELSKRIGITKPTLGKYRKEGKIPFSQVGRSIRYDYKEVMETLKIKKG